MNKIVEIRKKSKLSQSAFANRHNIPIRTLQQWEQGRRIPPSYVIKYLSEKENDFNILRKYKISPTDKFNICINDSFLNCEKIYPIQQKRIKNILMQVKHNNNVKKVIVFGSSVTNRCHIDSDIDLYLELDCNMKVSLNNINYKLDVWNNFSVSDELLKEIKNKGVVVYER